MCGNGTEKKNRLVEAEVPTIYSDGPAKVELHGHNIRITYFEYRELAGEIVKMPVLAMWVPEEVVGSEWVLELFRRARALGIALVDETPLPAH